MYRHIAVHQLFTAVILSWLVNVIVIALDQLPMVSREFDSAR